MKGNENDPSENIRPPRLRDPLKQPPWRTIIPGIALLLLVLTPYAVWSPGAKVIDGSHDRGTNAIWLQHGWLADDAWLARNGRDPRAFRDTPRMEDLRQLVGQHRIRYLFPHACPCSPNGTISPIDETQTEAFLDAFADFSVTPWIGGVLNKQCFPDDPDWRSNFVHSASAMLERHPRMRGVQVNIEPMPSGNPAFITLLAELKATLPEGKILSIAAYPPPTRWHDFDDVHWDQAYYTQIAEHADQLAVMMYDTAAHHTKLYEHIMTNWTEQLLTWVPNTDILLGIPTYDDADTGYHDPKVENLRHGLRGIHAGLNRFKHLPNAYRGVALYCEWEMDPAEWAYYREHFLER